MAEKRLSFNITGSGSYSKNRKGSSTVTQKNIGGSAAMRLMTGAYESVTARITGHAYAGKYSATNTASKWKGGGVTGGSVGYDTKNWGASTSFNRAPSGRGGTTMFRFNKKF